MASLSSTANTPLQKQQQQGEESEESKSNNMSSSLPLLQVLLDDNRYHVLVEFAYKHLDFQMAELKAVLYMNGILLDTHACRLVPLLNQDRFDQVVANDARYSNSNAAAAAATSATDTTTDEKSESATTNDHEQQQQQKKKMLHSNSLGIVPCRPFCILSLPLDSKWIPRRQQRNNNSHNHEIDNHGKKDMNKNESNDDNDDDDDIATILLSRCVLVRSVMQLYTMGPTMEACAATLASWTTTTSSSLLSLPTLPPRVEEIMQQRQRKDDASSSAAVVSSSWKMTIHTLGATFEQTDHAKFRAWFAPFFQQHYLTCTGPVVMRNPDEEFVLIREVELDANGGAMFPRFDFEKQLIEENDERSPLCCYFGRRLVGRTSSSSSAADDGGASGTSISRSTGCGSGGRPTNLWEQYSLKKRLYLGPTSMDSELSFIMTNLGHVQSGSMVMDPFVGTGSILLSCALQGAYCMGTDIDLRVLRGTTLDPATDINHHHSVPSSSQTPQQQQQQRPKQRPKQEQEDCDVFSNFRQFSLPLPDLIRSDNAIYHRHFRQHEPLYDAILCDPPYGIRAGARKSGSRKQDNGQASAAAAAADAVGPRPILEEHRSTHIAQTRPYPVQDVMADLLDMAARTLVRGGRLVYIIPSFSDFDADSDLPRHDCLTTVHICYQPLSMELGRHMVTMEKTADYIVDKRDEYISRIWKNGPASSEKCANIRQKILEAAKIKPRYYEKLAIRKKKRKETKEAKKKAKLTGQTP